MSLHKEVVSSIIPGIYANTAAVLRNEGGYGLYLDPSHSNRCSVMTSELLEELRARHLPCRRELHETPLGPHFMIVHALEGVEPSPDDVITDLTPWQLGNRDSTGYLHGSRGEVREKLAQADVGHEAIALRSFETITIAHTRALTPALAHQELN